ncbi:MAG TPA: hypothetical protein VG347_00810 [Verrucomicrobiae bacterium]|nr:hypothetical protein [Verrucomicrobiae bacterium]
MILKCSLLFCANEHGNGDVSFPDAATLDPYTVRQIFIKGNDARLLRADAKKEGWGRINGEDYCPACMESGV